MASDTSLIFNIIAKDKASKTIGKIGEKVSAASAGIGAAVAGAIGVGITSNLDVESATDKLAAQLGLTEAESERIGGVAGDLYSDAYGDSMEQVNAAVGSVMSSIEGMTEASSQELEAASAKALDFAATFDVDVTRSVQSVGTLMRSGLAADADEAFDLITAASQKVPAALREDVLDASDEYGQFFDTLGFSGEQAFAVLVEASAKGAIGIDKAGDAVKEFSVLSTDMSESSQEAYTAIGLDAHDMANAILAGGDSAEQATQKIIDGLLGITDPAAQAEAAIALFGTPLEDLNVTDIPEFLEALKGGGDAMEDFGGSAERMGETLNDNAKTSLEAFKRTVEMKLAEVGGSFVEFGMANQQYVQPLGIALAGLAAMVLLVKGGMMAWTAAVTLWTGVVAIGTAAQWAWNAAMTANPIALVVIAIAALIAIIVVIATKTRWFQTIWSGAMSGLKSGALAVVGFFSGGSWGNIYDYFVGPLVRATSWVTRKIGWMLDEVTELPGEIDAVTDGMWDGIKWAFRDSLNWIIGRWNDLSWTLPSVGIGPVKVGGGTLHTPNIPLLANGGNIQRAGAAIVGDAGPELLHMPAGAQVTPLTGGGFGGRQEVHVVLEVRGTDSEMKRMVRKMIRDVSGGNVQGAVGRG